MRQRRADKEGQHRTAFDKNKKKILATQSVCGICGKPVDLSYRYPHPLSAVIDHIIPISKGGHPSAMENLQLAHRWCNRQKADKFIDLKVKFAEESQVILPTDLPLHCDWLNYKAKIV